MKKCQTFEFTHVKRCGIPLVQSTLFNLSIYDFIKVLFRLWKRNTNLQRNLSISREIRISRSKHSPHYYHRLVQPSIKRHLPRVWRRTERSWVWLTEPRPDKQMTTDISFIGTFYDCHRGRPHVLLYEWQVIFSIPKGFKQGKDITLGDKHVPSGLRHNRHP